MGVYRSFLEKLRVEHGDKTVAGMQAKHGRAIIEAKERENARQRLLKLVSLLVKHAVETGMRDDNPTRDVEAEVPTSEGFLAWPEDQIADFRAAYPIRASRVSFFELALNTEQRRGELARMAGSILRTAKSSFGRKRPTKK